MGSALEVLTDLLLLPLGEQAVSLTLTLLALRPLVVEVQPVEREPSHAEADHEHRDHVFHYHPPSGMKPLAAIHSSSCQAIGFGSLKTTAQGSPTNRASLFTA